MDWLVCILASPGRGCLSRVSKPSRPQIIIKYRKKKKKKDYYILFPVELCLS